MRVVVEAGGAVYTKDEVMQRITFLAARQREDAAAMRALIRAGRELGVGWQALADAAGVQRATLAMQIGRGGPVHVLRPEHDGRRDNGRHSATA